VDGVLDAFPVLLIESGKNPAGVDGMVGCGTDQGMIGIAVVVAVVAAAVVGFVAVAVAIAVGSVVGIARGPSLRGSALFVSGFLFGTATHGQRSSVRRLWYDVVSYIWLAVPNAFAPR
jgi:hypothetical protein